MSNETNRRALIAGLLLAGALLSGCQNPEERFAAHLTDARTYLDAGDFELASVEIRNAVRLKFDNAEAHFVQGLVHEQQQNWPAALASLARAVELDPTLVSAHRRLASAYLLQDDHERAAASARTALELAPDDPGALATMGAVALGAGDLQLAREYAEQALQRRSEHADALAVLAGIELADGKVEAAKALLLQGIAANPDYLPIRVMRVQLAQSHGTPAEVSNTLQDIIAAFPSRLEFYRSLAAHHAARGDQAAAEQVLLDAIANNPQRVDAKVALLQAMARADVHKTIIRASAFLEQEKAVELQLVLAELRARTGEAEAARQIYEDVAEEAEPRFALRAIAELIKLALGEQQHQAAEEWFARGFALNESDFALLDLRVKSLLNQEQPLEAQLAAQNLVFAHPTSADALVLLGQVYEHNGRDYLAEDQYRRALELDARNLLAAKRLAGLHLDAGNPRRAEELLARILTIEPNDTDAARFLFDLKVKQNDWQAARKLVEGPLSDQSSVEIGHYIDARLARAAADLAGSTNAFSMALRANPEYAPAITGLIENARVDEDQQERALAALQALVTAQPDVRRPYLALSGLYLGAGRAPRAAATLDEAIRRHPDWLEARHAQVRLHLQQGDEEGAARAARSALEIDGDDTTARLALADLAMKRGAMRQAIEHYESIALREPTNLVAANNLASLLIGTSTDRKDIDRAYDALQPVRDTDNPAVLDTLGWAQVLRGEVADGRASLERARRAFPDNDVVGCHLAIAEYLQGSAQRDATAFDMCAGEPSANDVNVARIVSHAANGP